MSISQETNPQENPIFKPAHPHIITLNRSQAEPKAKLEAKPHSAKPQAELVYHYVTMAAVDQLIVTTSIPTHTAS